MAKDSSIPVTRAIITAILNNKLENTQTKNLNILNLNIPLSIDGVDSNLLEPEKCWTSPIKYKQAARALASLFIENMSNFVVTEEIAKSGASMQIKLKYQTKVKSIYFESSSQCPDTIA